MIKAKIILDSENQGGDRLTTWILTYPRFIHSELMTHRMFSRNAASSRAIPVKRMMEQIVNNPAVPEFWGQNQSGMQAAQELDDIITRPYGGDPKEVEGADFYNPPELLTDRQIAKRIWLDARDLAVAKVKQLTEVNLHKQIANRVTEPWMHITVLVSATQYENFFSLRAHKDAQPEFQVLAYTMLREYLASKPNKLREGQWHIPFGDRIPDDLTLGQRLKVATARAARLSYMTFDGDINLDKDYELHDSLAKSGHWSPFEHCARADMPGNWQGNFRGWMQYRKFFPNEDLSGVNLPKILSEMPTWVQEAINRNDQIKE